ncbi:MAG TPA: glycerophosphodiester phosphodiesterase [Longimicrobiaceae bacterium]|jgi:glycerophosphoryl diester phosphodiesterase
MAHRGGSALAPENTLEAFRRALEWWRADVLEVDVQPTADGEVVVIHDATVDRTTDGTGPLAGLRLAEVRALDAGFRFTPDGGRTFPFRGAGVRISTLEELLLAFPGARVNVEIKDARAQRRTWETVHDLGATHRVLIAAGHRANRSRFGAYPGPTSASGEEMKAFYLHHLTRTTRWWRPPVDAFQMPERFAGRQVLTPRLLREVHARNLAVHVWTVDEVADMRRLLEWGVDGIVTDRPDRLARVLHEMFGRPLPPGDREQGTGNREQPATADG